MIDLVFLFRISYSNIIIIHKVLVFNIYVYAVKNIFRSRALVNTVEVGGKWPGELASSKSQSCQLKLLKLRTRLCIIENIKKLSMK